MSKVYIIIIIIFYGGFALFIDRLYFIDNVREFPTIEYENCDLLCDQVKL